MTSFEAPSGASPAWRAHVTKFIKRQAAMHHGQSKTAPSIAKMESMRMASAT